MPKRAITSANAPKTYAELREAVLAVVHRGRREIERAWVQTYHDTGRLIHEHLLFKQARADYGARVFADLAADSGIAKRTLHEWVQFYRCFPIVRSNAQLTRTHYLLLCQVGDVKQRVALTGQAMKGDWSVADLRSHVRAVNAASDRESRPAAPADRTVGPDLLVPQCGTPGLHRVVEKSLGLSVDLGFRHYWPLTPAQAKRWAKGDIVRIADDDSLRPAPDATKAMLFTYAARLVRVVDGDTLVIALEVSPGVFLEQKLRLRGLDCPEMSTPEGRAAKRFVDDLSAKATNIVIQTTKPDKYDRYLADVFLTQESADLGQSVGAEEAYLNNALLSSGHAVRKDAEDFGKDWGFKE